MYSISKLFFAIGLVFLILLGSSNSGAGVLAADDTAAKLSISPIDADGSYFTLTMSPGETRQLSVELNNHGEAAVDAHTYAADAYTLVNGGFGVRLADEPTGETTRWLSYASETMTIEPQTALVRTFEVTVPPDAEPGQYLSAVVIQNANPTGGNDTGVGFQQVTRQAIAVAIDIPGDEQTGLAIGETEHLMVAGLSVIRTAIENTGNVHLQLNGEFTLTATDGREITRLPVSLDSVYAQTDTLVEMPLLELLPAGEYMVDLWLEDTADGVRAESDTLLLTVPALVAPQPVQPQDPAAVAVPATQPAAEPQTGGIPDWAILAAIPVSIVLGALIAGAIVVLSMRRRTAPIVAEAHDVAPEAVVVNEQPAMPITRNPAIVRQIVPPSRTQNAPAPQGEFH